jgi:hypothetical protein
MIKNCELVLDLMAQLAVHTLHISNALLELRVGPTSRRTDYNCCAVCRLGKTGHWDVENLNSYGCLSNVNFLS